MNEIVPASAGLVPANMDEALRLAKVMSSTRLVPEHLQGDVGGCMLIIEQAIRWRMSPFAVAQCTSLIHGRLMHEGKLVAAAAYASGALATRFAYTYSGEGDDRACTVTARLRGESADRTINVVLRDVRTTGKDGKPNKQWTGGQVDQQLSYAGVRAWARRHAPEVLLGVYAPEEFDEPSQAQHRGPTIDAEVDAPSPAPDARDAINASVPLRAAAADTPRAARVAEKAQVYEAPHPLDEANPRQWLLNLETMLATAQSQDEVVDIAGHTSVGTATARAPRDVKQRVTELLAGAYARFAEEPEGELPEVEIVGEKHLAG